MIAQKTRVLILVMTYLHPSRRHQELFCTAGITEAGEWVRLYPVDYRYRPRSQQFKKYHWIEAELEPRGVGNDSRKESRRPNLETIQVLGERLSSKNGWRARREIVDPLPHFTIKQLKEAFELDKTSRGIVRRNKFYTEMCGPGKAPRFFMVTFFWPPRDDQQLLFRYQYSGFAKRSVETIGQNAD